MKLDEFKKIEEEFRFSDLLGTDYASRFNPKDYEVKPRLSKDAFIKDFIEDAVASLDSGIKGGLIDPNPQVPTIGSKINPPPTPATGSKPTSQPAAGNNPSTAPATKSRTGGKIAGQLSTDPRAVARRQATAARRATQAGLTVSDPNTQTKSTAPAAPAAPAATAPAQAGATKVSSNSNNYSAAAKKYNLPTNKFNESYIKLNQIFEDIITTEETGGASGISNYLKSRWYPSYMKGVNYSQAQQVIDKTLDEIQMTYRKDKGMAALKKLAELSFALSKDNVPAGAKDVEQEQPQKAQQPEPQVDSNQIATGVMKNLTDLQKSDPEAFIKLLNDIQKLKQSAFTSRPEGTLGVSTPAAQKQVAESKNIKKSSKK